MVELSCVVHVHSTYSDGTATVPELLAAARAARADALLLTDHDTLGAKRDGWEGRHDGVLLIVGHEISPRGGHLLAFGTDAVVPHRARSEAELCAAVAAAGGFGIAAHPFSRGWRVSRTIGRPHPWGALEAPGCVGIELWSLATDEAETWTSPRQAWRALRDPRVLEGPPEHHLRLWDALCARRRTVAVGGLDAHQPGVRIRGRVRSIMPHARWFGLLRTQVLLDRAPDEAAVLAALCAGHCYLARVDLAPSTGFAFTARAPDGRELGMGDEARFAAADDEDAPPGRAAAAADEPRSGAWLLEARVPRTARLRLLCGGRVVAAVTGTALTHSARGAGAYRVEALLGARRWIVSNPIYLR